MMDSVSFLRGARKREPKRIVSVLPNSYTLLADKPAINGVELTRDTTSEQLSILSSDVECYKTVTLSSAAQEGLSVIALSANGEAAKIAVGDLFDVAKSVKTVEELDETAEIGTYQKVIIKSED